MQKHNTINRSNGHKPSRFLVDLPGLVSEAEKEQKIKKKKIYERLFIFEIIKGVFVLGKKLVFIFSILAFVWKIFKKIKKFKPNFNFKKRQKINHKINIETTKEIDEEPEEEDVPEEGFIRRFFALLRPAIAFAVIISFLVLPFKVFLEFSKVHALEGRVMGITEGAIDDLMTGGEAIKLKDFRTAEKYFKSAQSALREAQAEISWLTNVAEYVNQIASQEKTLLAEQVALLIRAGILGTDLAAHVSHTLAEVSAAKGQNFSEIIKKIDLYLTTIEKTNNDLALTLNKIRPELIPEEYRPLVVDAKNKGLTLSGGAREFIALFKVLREVLGFEYDTRHLLVFQNNSELRASGGFIGSYALVDFHNAEIKNLEVPTGGTYDTEAGLKEMIKSPDPLQLLKSRWYFWDANWWPDWERSAEHLAWFLEKSNGPSVDGVISLTPTFIERLLAVSGPIKVKGKFDLEVNSENLYTTVQSIVEDRTLYPVATSTDQESKPKEIIGDVFDAMLEQIPERLDQDMIIKLGQLLINNFYEKHILLYFSDEDNQAVISQLDWSGEQKDSAQDYLMVVNTNIGGGKSDRKIADTYELESVIKADNSVENILKINRHHMAYKNEKLVGVRNVDWLRVYVPRGAVLLEAEGFVVPDEKFFETPDEFLEDNEYIAGTEGMATTHISGTKIYNENNKTVFANWLMLDPGESKTIVLRYRLPSKVDSNTYELLAQKQPGTLNASLYYTLCPNTEIS
ncbi:MAG: DUF4012 domain-containing protein, partial [Patescibacteria group bacterium]|nr:DUF4012 domain-containing protein [Patescibacteria group bacterium]